MFTIPTLSFSAQNCNSLNLSGLSTNLEIKLEAITASKADIILLSDVRLVNSRGIKGSERVSQYLRDNKNCAYTLYHHSTGQGRGVAILAAITLGITVINTWKDQHENALIMDIEYSGRTYTIGAIYGPNNTSREFFRFLGEVLENSQGEFKVVGGDWNTTWDKGPAINNIDTLEMVSVPNPVNSGLLGTLCGNHSLTDPFRILHPMKRDFSYSPFGTQRANRSRIDFFITSSNLIPFINECNISSAPLCALFDHKNISLKLGTCERKIKKSKRLTNMFLDSRYLELCTTMAAIRTHIVAIDPMAVVNVELLTNYANIGALLEDMKLRIERLKQLLLELEQLELQKAKTDECEQLELLISAKIAWCSLAIQDMVPLHTLEKIPKRCTDIRFFEVLVDETRKAGIKAQKS